MAKKKSVNKKTVDAYAQKINERMRQLAVDKANQKIEKKNSVIRESNTKAENYYKEAEKYGKRADTISKYAGMANEIAKSFVKPYVRAAKSASESAMLNPAGVLLQKLTGKKPIPDKVPWLGEVKSYKQSGKEAINLLKEKKYKRASGSALEDTLDVASIIPGVGIIPGIVKSLKGARAVSKAKKAVDATKVVEKVSKSREIAKKAIEAAKPIAKTSVVGGGYTAGYAAAEGMKQDKPIEDIIKDIYSQAPYGAVLAGGLHGVAKGVHAGVTAARGSGKPKAAPEIEIPMSETPKPSYDLNVRSDKKVTASDIKRDLNIAKQAQRDALAIGLIQKQGKLEAELKDSPSPDHYHKTATELEDIDAMLKDVRNNKMTDEDIRFVREELYRDGIDVSRIEERSRAMKAGDSPDLSVQGDSKTVQDARSFSESSAEPKSGDVDVVVTDRRSLIKKYQRDMDLQGRLTDRPGGTKLGSYSPYQRLIRLRGDANFETFVHEVGHDLDASKTVDYRSFKDELKPMDYDQSKMRATEGFAEFMRLYVTDRPTAQRVAPKFFAHFEANVPVEVRGILNDATSQYSQFTSMTRGAQMRSMISGKPQTTVDRIKEGISDNGVLGTVRNAFDSFYTNIVDKFHPIKRNLGEKVYNQFRISAGKQALVDATLKENTIDFNTLRPNGEGFEKILGDLDVYAKESGKSPDEVMTLFGQYLINRRAANDVQNDMVFGFRRQSHGEEAAKLEAQFPEFKALSDRVYSYQDRVLDYVHDAGVITDDLYQKLKQNKNYVPFFFDKERAKTQYPQKRGQQTGAPVKRFADQDIKGTVINPIESIYKNTYVLMTAANNNQVMLSVLNRLRELPKELSPFIREIQKPKKPITLKDEEIQKLMKEFGIDMKDESDEIGQMFATALELMQEKPMIFRTGNAPKATTLYALDKGVSRPMEVADPQLFDALAGLNSRSIEALKTGIKVLSVPASTLRAGATLSPSFMTRNVIRDALSASVYSKHGISLPFSQLANTIGALMKKSFGESEVFNLYRSSGGELANLVALDRKTINEQLAFFGKTGESPVRGYAAEWMGEPLKPLRDVSTGIEKSTRIGEYQRALNKYMVAVSEGKMTEKEAVELAGFDSREITLDFARQGKLFEAFGYNRIAAFFNATIQGTDKMFRELATSPAAWAKAFSYITLPSVALWYANKDNPDYQNLPEWRKNIFWNIPTGDADMPFITIPKPFELGVLFGTAPEKILDSIVKDDPKAIENLEGAFAGFGLPNILPTFATPFLENYSNRSYFFDSAIVPESKTDLPEELQSRSTTPEYLKDAAEASPIPFSPAKAEQFIYDYTGGLGRMASQGADAVYRSATDKPEAPSRFSPSVDLGMKILKELGLATEAPIGTKDVSTQNFYDDYTKATGEMKATKEKMKGGEDPSRYVEGAVKSKPLGAVAAALTSIRKQKDAVKSNRNMTGDEKRMKLDELDRLQSKLLNSVGY